MPEPFALTCDSCGEPLLPNLSQADADGCLWICINPDCPELCAGELETGDLVEAGVPQALAGRLVRLIDFYEDTVAELREECAGEGEEGADADGGGAAAPPPAGSRERAQAAAAAGQLGLELAVSYHSDEFAEAQDAQRLLAAAAALCGAARHAAARHAAADAEKCLAGIDPELPGLLTASEL